MFEHNLMSDGMDVMHILKGAGATFLARHVAMDGARAVETVKKAILNKGFSLVHMPYPCPHQFRIPGTGVPKPGKHLQVD